VSRFAFFYQSIISDWNHGNAHFLRGLVRALQARGQTVVCYEHVDNWSLTNLLRVAPDAIQRFERRFSDIRYARYSLGGTLEGWLRERLVALGHARGGIVFLGALAGPLAQGCAALIVVEESCPTVAEVVGLEERGRVAPHLAVRGDVAKQQRTAGQSSLKRQQPERVVARGRQVDAGLA
jgi:hypothetical protein